MIIGMNKLKTFSYLHPLDSNLLLVSYDKYSDDILATLLREGDRNVFTEIYNRYWNKLYFIAYRHLKETYAAEEIVQNVFFSLWQKRETLEIQGLSAYLAAMTRYAVYKYLAKEKRKQEVEKQGSSNLNRIESPHDAIDHHAVMELVQKLTNVLPEKCRLVFIHNKLLDKPLDEVANAMDISIKTAEAHITKALKIVRSKLGNALHLLLL